MGAGCAIGAPSLPLSMSAISFSADDGMTGRTASASMRIATTNVPSTSAIRSGSLFFSTQGAAASTYWLQANTAPIQASRPAEKAKRSNSLSSEAQAWRTLSSSAPSSRRLAGRGKNAVQILENHRQAALGKVAEAVGQFGVDAG